MPCEPLPRSTSTKELFVLSRFPVEPGVFESCFDAQPDNATTVMMLKNLQKCILETAA